MTCWALVLGFIVLVGVCGFIQGAPPPPDDGDHEADQVDPRVGTSDAAPPPPPLSADFRSGFAFSVAAGFLFMACAVGACRLVSAIARSFCGEPSPAGAVAAAAAGEPADDVEEPAAAAEAKAVPRKAARKITAEFPATKAVYVEVNSPLEARLLA